jgi:hypothetical protein
MTPASFVVKLLHAVDRLSPSLRDSLSPATRQELEGYDQAQPLPDTLLEALIVELNQLLQGSPLYDKRRFRGTTWRKERETLMKALIKQVEGIINKDPNAGDGITCFNRLLMEEIYPDEIKKSAKAEWEAWTLLADAAKRKVIKDWEDWKAERQKWKKTGQGKARCLRPRWMKISGRDFETG